MKNVRIVLVEVEENERQDLEFIENQKFSNEQQVRDLFKGEILIFTLDTFMEACNDQEINLELYWFTYVEVLF